MLELDFWADMYLYSLKPMWIHRYRVTEIINEMRKRQKRRKKPPNIYLCKCKIYRKEETNEQDNVHTLVKSIHCLTV